MTRSTEIKLVCDRCGTIVRSEQPEVRGPLVPLPSGWRALSLFDPTQHGDRVNALLELCGPCSTMFEQFKRNAPTNRTLRDDLNAQSVEDRAAARQVVTA